MARRHNEEHWREGEAGLGWVNYISFAPKGAARANVRIPHAIRDHLEGDKGIRRALIFEDDEESQLKAAAPPTRGLKRGNDSTKDGAKQPKT